MQGRSLSLTDKSGSDALAMLLFGKVISPVGLSHEFTTVVILHFSVPSTRAQVS